MNFTITLQNAVGDKAIVVPGPLGLTMVVDNDRIVLSDPPECVVEWIASLYEQMQTLQFDDGNNQ